jgi:hypothetical protein
MLGITNSGADVTVGEYRNNIALAATDFSNRNNADEADNSWSIGGITVSDADFQNVSVEGLDAPCKADGSLLAAVSPSHAYTALCVILVTSVVILSQLYPVERKKAFLEPDAWLAISLIIASFTGLYFVK